MYDDKDVEVVNKAAVLILEVRLALALGTKHYRKSDGRFLQTDREILQTLVDEKELIFEPVREGVST